MGFANFLRFGKFILHQSVEKKKKRKNANRAHMWKKSERWMSLACGRFILHQKEKNPKKAIRRTHLEEKASVECRWRKFGRGGLRRLHSDTVKQDID